jgi:hypothetical protein
MNPFIPSPDKPKITSIFQSSRASGAIVYYTILISFQNHVLFNLLYFFLFLESLLGEFRIALAVYNGKKYN